MSSLFHENGCGGAVGGNENSGPSMPVSTSNSSSDIVTDSIAYQTNNSEFSEHSDLLEENCDASRKQQFNALLAQVKDFYEDSNEECRQQLRSTRKQNDELSKEVKVVQCKLASVETEIANLKSEDQNKAELIKQLQEQLGLSKRDHESQIKSLKEEAAEARINCNEMIMVEQRKVTILETSNANLVAKCNGLELSKHNYESENWELEQEIGKLKGEMESLEGSIKQGNSPIRKICFQRDTLKLEKQELEKQKREQGDELLSQNGALENDNRALSKKVKELTDTRDKILEKILPPEQFQAIKRMLDMPKSNLGSSSSSTLDSRKRRKCLQGGNTATGSGTFPRVQK